MNMQWCRRGGCISSVRRAFTLIEVVMVLAIIVVLAAIAVPRYGRVMGRYRADIAARRVVTDFEWARTEARATSGVVTVAFEPAPRNCLRISALAALDDSSESYIVHFDNAPYQAQLVSAVFGTDQSVNFDGFGQPDSGGTVVVESGGIRRTIVLNVETGWALVQ